jgi:hypothetical protein
LSFAVPFFFFGIGCSAVAMLSDEIDSRLANNQAAILKTTAEAFLMRLGYTRLEARSIIASDSFDAVPGTGKGHPVELHRHGKDATAEVQECSDSTENADPPLADSRRRHLERTAEISSSKGRINKSDSQPAISAVGTPSPNGKPLAAKPKMLSGGGIVVDLGA